MKCAWIKQHAEELAADAMCRLIGVFGSAYYGWLMRGPAAGERHDATFSEMIQATFGKNRTTYGTRRLKALLSPQGRVVNRRRIGRLMCEAGLASKAKLKFTWIGNSPCQGPIRPIPAKLPISILGKVGYIWP